MTFVSNSRGIKKIILEVKKFCNFHPRGEDNFQPLTLTLDALLVSAPIVNISSTS